MPLMPSLPIAIVGSCLPFSAAQGNDACWTQGFTYNECCTGLDGGNPACWDGFHTYATCCLKSSASPDDNFDELIRRGRHGDASVLPRILQLVSAGSGMGCEDEDGLPGAACQGGPVISGKEWQAFLNAHALSRFIRLQPWPKDGDPAALFKRCCSDSDAESVLLDLAEDCPAGVAALQLSTLASVERSLGRAAAQRRLQLVQGILARHVEGRSDCRWEQKVNHASFQNHAWFLSEPGQLPEQFPCTAGISVYVEESTRWEELRAHPLTCSHRGLCFTEVYLHQFLRHSACRTRDRATADVVYVPIYSSCYGLDSPKEDGHAAALDSLLTSLQEKGAEGAGQPPLLLVFSCEVWKLRGWRRPAQGAIVAAVEAKPLLDPGSGQGTGSAPRGGSVRRLWHCQDCFSFGNGDLVLPSAVLPVDAMRLRNFNRAPGDRTLLLTWRGEHAESLSSREDVRVGYLEVNETVRPALLRHMQGKPDVSVGGSSIRYSFLMGTAHFCLIPRGRGWWTVRLFEAFYAGCIPVILSDDLTLPFQSILDWERFSLKWPMRRVDKGLYEHLAEMVSADMAKVLALHEAVRKVACWFDYHAPADAGCSPYQGMLLELVHSSRRARGDQDGTRQPVPDLRASQPTRFWF